MEFTHAKSFIKQITLYLQNKDNEKAHKLAKEFSVKFPNDLISHFLLSKACFNIRDYDGAKLEGRKAFNMSHSYEDMLACALLTSMAYLETKEYEKGFSLLKEMEKKGTSEELELALVTFSLALKNEAEALDHIKRLFALNEELATDLANRMIEA
jgi:tetratricopeptide (TPR) repeat protein